LIYYPSRPNYSSATSNPDYAAYLYNRERQEDQKRTKELTQPLYEGKTVPEWKKSLKNWDRHVREHAAYALGQLGSQAKDAIPISSTP
jgi:hypothetical protein